MKSIGTYSIYLTGSRKTIRRSVKVDEETNKCFIIWYGNLIEVERGIGSGFLTVEDY